MMHGLEKNIHSYWYKFYVCENIVSEIQLLPLATLRQCDFVIVHL